MAGAVLLQPGTTLGPYAVSAKLGQGGMGEVWRARDTTLDRDVALKVLPEAFTADPDRLARFEREAKILASLNHPNIASIYGLEESEGGQFRALVLELVEGPTLADRIARGPIPIDDALPIARQIAEALEAAHEAGVIHRDLKPANIKVRDDGTVKVLDFGLAKLDPLSPRGEGRGEGDDPTESPTLTAAATRTGVLMGTPAYMSPEQAKGQAVDKRSDVWSFGCVLYEMLTGRRAFAGDSVSETLVAVLSAGVDLEALPTGVPRAARRLLRRCFERQPMKRLRDMTEGLLHVEEELEGRSEDPSASVIAPSRIAPARQALPWVAAIALAVVAAFVGWGVRPVPNLAPPTRDAFTTLLPADIKIPRESRFVGAISPDGQHLVFVGRRGDTTQLYHRALDQLAWVPIPETEGATSPFFSPDGAWVGFKLGSSLRRVPLAGGESLPICDLPVDGPTCELGFGWSADDTIWFACRDTGLYQVSATGGLPQLVTTPDTNEVVRGHTPHPLPGGRAILYYNDGWVHVYDTETGTQRALTEGRSPRWAASGHVVVSRARGDAVAGGPGSGQGDAATAGAARALWALPFDLDRLEEAGEAVPVREGVSGYALDSGSNSFLVSTRAYLAQDGTLAYIPAVRDTNERTLVWVSQDGGEEPISAPPRRYQAPRISPDGTRVAMMIEGDIWIHDLASGVQAPFTFDPALDAGPIWTRDGERIAFYSLRGGRLATYWKAADGTGAAEMLLSAPEPVLAPWSWSADGLSLLGPVPGQGYDVGIFRIDSDRLQILLEGPSSDGWPEVSPDGRLMAHGSSATGARQIGIVTFPDVRGSRLFVPDESILPVWSRDGSELYYRNQNIPALMAVPVQSEPTLTIGEPRILFEDAYYGPGNLRDFDVAPDGRFLMIKDSGAAGNTAPLQINVIRGWADGLNERAPAN